ncbi:hypothetical protein G4B88_003498 [Cannabis sativa]|uniref:RNase H type-1 domain-containing protein n=1 Tax=Cannabis sativa TaxID=3483 RepID=A0A7J6GU18_CANSA|nr:hypothetical protein G4B88_003498 [Cannabis sativa]
MDNNKISHLAMVFKVVLDPRAKSAHKASRPIRKGSGICIQSSEGMRNKASTLGDIGPGKKRRLDCLEDPILDSKAKLLSGKGDIGCSKKICFVSSGILSSTTTGNLLGGDEDGRMEDEGKGTAGNSIEVPPSTKSNSVLRNLNKIIVRFGMDRNVPEWIGCFTYAPPRRSLRSEFWKDLSVTMGDFSCPWMVMGDLNSVLSADEKSGGRPVTRAEGQGLRDFMFKLGGNDLEGVGALFTWSNGQSWDKLIREKLDRVVVSASWISYFKKAGVRNLAVRHSDHGVIVMDTRMDREVVKTPFRYLDAWSRDPGCRRIIEEAWSIAVAGFQSFRLCHRLRSTAKALCKWNREVFGHCQFKLQALERLLSEVQSRDPSQENNLGFDVMSGDEKFMGNPILFNGRRSSDFEFIIDKISSRRSRDIDFCLIAKLGWSLASASMSLWTSVINAKYCKHSGFLSSILPAKASPVARGIWATRDFIASNSVWIIGQNSYFNLWSHHWKCGDSIIVHEGHLNPLVKSPVYLEDLTENDASGWNDQMVERVFVPATASLIKSSDRNLLPVMDVACWKSSKDGRHFVSGCPVTIRLWFSSRWGLHPDALSFQNGRDLISWLSQTPFQYLLQPMDSARFFLYGAVLYHKFWLARNDAFHNGVPVDLSSLKKNIDQWGLPRPGRVRGYVDFASAREFGAGAVVFFDSSGGILACGAKKIMTLDVLQGELEALLFGVYLAKDLQLVGVDFFTDNALLVKGLIVKSSPSWLSHFSFVKLYELLVSLDCSVSWISRVLNKAAHALARWGLSHSCNGLLCFWEVSPHVLTKLCVLA